jgi:hypothetical protein
MLKKIGALIRTCAFLVALYMLSGGPPLLASGPSDCAGSAVGGQTGQPYTLTYQSLVTETTTGTISAGSGSCGIGASLGATTSEQFYVGYYRNEVTEKVVKVDCRTGRVIG